MVVEVIRENLLMEFMGCSAIQSIWSQYRMVIAAGKVAYEVLDTL